MLGISFWLVRNVLHSEIPQPADDLILTDPRVSKLGLEFAQRLARGATYDFESTEYFRLILRLREKRSDRCRYLWRLVWTPGVGDVAAVQLPEGLFLLYRIVRMGRLVGKWRDRRLSKFSRAGTPGSPLVRFTVPRGDVWSIDFFLRNGCVSRSRDGLKFSCVFARQR